MELACLCVCVCVYVCVCVRVFSLHPFLCMYVLVLRFVSRSQGKSNCHFKIFCFVFFIFVLFYCKWSLPKKNWKKKTLICGMIFVNNKQCRLSTDLCIAGLLTTLSWSIEWFINSIYGLRLCQPHVYLRLSLRFLICMIAFTLCALFPWLMITFWLTSGPLELTIRDASIWAKFRLQSINMYIAGIY